jgi:hypothetical protein
MDQICLVVPVLPGRTADARDFTRKLERAAGGRCMRRVIRAARGRQHGHVLLFRPQR